MRPVDKGEHPLDNSGNPIRYTDYRMARRELINRLGEFCSYCEMHLDASLAVEHVQPKSLNQNLEFSWNNLLLSCVNCNSTKGDREIALNEYFWPDKENTFLAFEYTIDGVVQPSTRLSCMHQQIAKRTLELVGLDKTPDQNPSASDRRWQNRREAWGQAVLAKSRLDRCNTLELREQITEAAYFAGYWSIWLTVFKDDTDMRNRFISRFPGTCADCFDEQREPISRHGGQI